ncbi:MAG: hypothetical protein ACPLRZ_07735 [Thermovenabulum sp.]|uniref:hypothetical protein n=1 Tax=Thermovenabulum sp. TaxID=3100335 RepID=UPI003C7BECBB
MTRKEMEREKYCLLSKCKYYKICEVKWGKECIRHQGSRIPRIRFTNYYEEKKLVVTGAPGEKVRIRANKGDTFFG